MSDLTGRLPRSRAFGRVLVWVLVLGTAGCGASATTPAGRSTPGSGAVLTVLPSAGLVAGQQLRVRLARFPTRATVVIQECARGHASGAVKACAGFAIVYTGTTGTASGLFVAQSAVSGRHGAVVRCRDQCVLVGVVVKRGHSAPRNQSPIATARLTFSASNTPHLADEFLQELSWSSPTVGWALATQPCGTWACVRLASTSNGGDSWHALPDPPVTCRSGVLEHSSLACVSAVSFATPVVGYLYGPGLLMTIDGGIAWHRVPGLQVESLAVVDGEVWRVAYRHTGCPGPCEPVVQEAKIGSRAWRTVIAKPVTPGRSGSSQFVASGSTLLLAMYGSQAGPVSAQATVYRSTNAGVTWQLQADPCSGKGPGGERTEEDLNNLSAAPGSFFAGVCSPHEGSGIFVVTSTDAGRSWHKSGSLPPVQGPATIAAASSKTLAISTGGEYVICGGADHANLTVRSLPQPIHPARCISWTSSPTETTRTTSSGAALVFKVQEIIKRGASPS